jgi:hypothetical protein
MESILATELYHHIVKNGLKVKSETLYTLTGLSFILIKKTGKETSYGIRLSKLS